MNPFTDSLKSFKEQHRRDTYLFDPQPFGKIYTFVDWGNVRCWAKYFWPSENKKNIIKNIDIQKVSELIDCIHPDKKFFYYGFYKDHPELPFEHALNKRHRKSKYRIDLAQKSGFTVRSKHVKEISNFDDEGHYQGVLNKCNFDVEISMDLLLKAPKFDTVFLWSGDSDFHHLLEHLKFNGKKIVIASVRDFLSTELQSVADFVVPADAFKEILEFVPPVISGDLK